MLKIDEEFKSLIPPLSDEEREQLERNIIEDGCRDPLVVWDDVLIDGHNRFEICTQKGVDFKTVQKKFTTKDDAKIWIIQNQFGRRNLVPFVRGELALQLKPLITAKAKANQGTRTDICQKSDKSLQAIDTKKELAKIADLSHDTIAKVEAIAARATPEVKEALRKGETSINAEYKKLTVHVANNSGENEWYTPSEFIEMARAVMGEINLDPASCSLAQKYIKADTFFDCESDGLENEWFGRVWLNPPYSKDLCSRFATKLIESLDAGVLEAIVLVNNATETGWMQELLDQCSAVCFPAGRLKFLDSTGKPANSPLQGQAFVYFGENTTAFKDVFSKCGQVFTRKPPCIATWVMQFNEIEDQLTALKDLFDSIDPQVMGLVRKLVEVVDD